MPVLTAQRRAQIREGIEVAAIDLFVRKGFHGTTTREIATEAGLSTGGLYAHYTSKDELFAAVIERYHRLFAHPDNPILRYYRACRFPDDIGELARAIETLIREHREFWLLWYVDVLEFGGAHFAPNFLTGTLQDPALLARLDAIEAEGRLRVDARLAFRMVYMHLFNFLLVEILFRGTDHYGVPADQAVSAIEDVLLRGLLS